MIPVLAALVTRCSLVHRRIDGTLILRATIVRGRRQNAAAGLGDLPAASR
jgi:hypothetical protein